MDLSPSAQSWVPADEAGDFSIHNLPFGIFSVPGAGHDGPASAEPRVGVRIGDLVLDLTAFTKDLAAGTLPDTEACAACFGQPTLNAFAAKGRSVHRAVRRDLQRVLVESGDLSDVLEKNTALKEKALVPIAKVKMHLPMQIGDYTDFYAGYHHAYKIGVLFRGPENALQPNYVHLPVGYHGRSSSIVVSGTPIRRPWGQILENPAATPKQPITAPCRRLDYELELGCFICKPNDMGTPVDVNNAEEHIFGYVLLNDWSARDIQAWEYVPLGPFNSKNFGSTVSAWVVTADAMEPFRAEPLANSTTVQEYMNETEKKSVFDIKCEVSLTVNGQTSTLGKTSSQNLLWSFPQMIAHHTLGGCPLQAGDLLGSGTISGAESNERGSLLEMTEGGKQDVHLQDGQTRKFLQDGDTLTLRGACEKDGRRIGFGTCEGTVEAAIQR
ncbi:Fumarylacetoacetase [Paramyrothecium foliicola]|nr:Fumarylacetoacetase [Paramyrothecium foliicola]